MTLKGSWLGAFSAILVLALTSGCASSDAARQSSLRKFHEARKTDVVVNFPSWSCIMVNKPLQSDGHFQRIFSQQTVRDFLAGLPAEQHNLIAVICSVNSSDPRDLQRVSKDITQWREMLKSMGFKRVVFLEANMSRDLNYKPVLEDTQLTEVAQASP